MTDETAGTADTAVDGSRRKLVAGGAIGAIGGALALSMATATPAAADPPAEVDIVGPIDVGEWHGFATILPSGTVEALSASYDIGDQIGPAIPLDTTFSTSRPARFGAMQALSTQDILQDVAVYVLPGSSTVLSADGEPFSASLLDAFQTQPVHPAWQRTVITVDDGISTYPLYKYVAAMDTIVGATIGDGTAQVVLVAGAVSTGLTWSASDALGFAGVAVDG